MGFSRDAAIELARRTSDLSDDLATHAAETYVREELRLRARVDQAARDLLEMLLQRVHSGNPQDPSGSSRPRLGWEPHRGGIEDRLDGGSVAERRVGDQFRSNGDSALDRPGISPCGYSNGGDRGHCSKRRWRVGRRTAGRGARRPPRAGHRAVLRAEHASPEPRRGPGRLRPGRRPWPCRRARETYQDNRKALATATVTLHAFADASMNIPHAAVRPERPSKHPAVSAPADSGAQWARSATVLRACRSDLPSRPA